MMGTDVYENMMEYSINRPIERSVITNWNDIEILWRNAFENMRKGRCARYLKIFLMKSESLLGIQKMKERFEHFMQMVGIF